MSQYIEKVEKLSLPLIAVDGVVVFPSEIINFEVSPDIYGSDEAVRDAASSIHLAIAVPVLRTEASETDNSQELFDVGTVVRIKQLVKSGDGVIRVVAEGLSRAIVNSHRRTGNFCTADAICKTIAIPEEGSIRGEAYRREMLSSVERIIRMLPTVSKEMYNTLKSIKSPVMMADFIASNILVKYEDKLDILHIFEPYKRIETLLSIMEHEAEILECETDIHKKTQAKINKSQREYYLREEMRAIQEELGENMNDSDDFREKIMKLNLSDEVRDKLLKENDKLSKTPFGSAEANVLANYLETCLSLPWNKETKDRTNIETARKILDGDHYGLEDVKKRLLEFLAVKQLNPEIKGQILCLVGPPGVGKTSVAASLARAMKRKYVRVSLGGVRDEADIRGHRKTYVGAMPGRIIAAVNQAGVRNPLILLDEIDKMTSDSRGDPASAMLEVLDPEQNRFFRDHFIELPFDLSDCIFIATANTLDTVPRPLIDRMEIIELNTYTKTEKLNIAKNHLMPKQLKKHGLSRRTVKITDDAVSKIIDCYTRESGVRNLERELGALCRRAALQIIETGQKHLCIDAQDVKSYLGPEKILPETIAQADEVGVVNGLAYTQAGGDLLKIEVAVMDGDGKLELTGSLGDVMKESAKAAYSCVRQLAHLYGIPSDFYKTKDIHIHVPEGAVPKDGPSAGVTMLTALVSALSGIPVRHDIAMTGEITLRGNVLAIGGLREKTMAAYAAGVKTVLIPAENLKDIEKTDSLVRENITFIPCSKASDVLNNALAVPVKINEKSEKSENLLFAQAKHKPEITRNIV